VRPGVLLPPPVLRHMEVVVVRPEWPGGGALAARAAAVGKKSGRHGQIIIITVSPGGSRRRVWLRRVGDGWSILCFGCLPPPRHSRPQDYH
jgi:hypothetical protein